MSGKNGALTDDKQYTFVPYNSFECMHMRRWTYGALGVSSLRCVTVLEQSKVLSVDCLLSLRSRVCMYMHAKRCVRCKLQGNERYTVHCALELGRKYAYRCIVGP